MTCCDIWDQPETAKYSSRIEFFFINSVCLLFLKFQDKTHIFLLTVSNIYTYAIYKWKPATCKKWYRKMNYKSCKEHEMKCSILHCGDADWCHRCIFWWSAYVLFNDWTNRREFKIHNWCACLWINIFSQVISSFFLFTDFNRLAELLISCLVFQKCDAMADLYGST